MALMRWEPFRDLVATQDQLNRLFNETFSRTFGGQDPGTGTWIPPVDIHETDENFVLQAELPGVDPKNVEVRMEGNTLHLAGRRSLEKDAKDENYHRIERAYGSFARTFTLPSSIDAEKVKAEYKDGLLMLTVPKREEAKPKTIEIKVAGHEDRRLSAHA